MLSITQEGQQTFAATFYPVLALHGAALRFNLAFLGRDLHSKVSAGENTGEALRHAFVVLELAQTPMTIEGNSYHSSLNIDLPREPAGHSIQVAFWVTPAGQMRSLQAAGGNLIPML